MVAQETGASCDRGGIEDFEAGWLEKLTMIHADTNSFIEFWNNPTEDIKRGNMRWDD